MLEWTSLVHDFKKVPTVVIDMPFHEAEGDPYRFVPFHREQLKEWLAGGRFPRKSLLLRRLGGYTVDRYHPGSGG